MSLRYDLTVFFSTIPLTSYLNSNKFLFHVHTHIHMFTKAKPFANGTGTRRKKKGGEQILYGSSHVVIYPQIDKSFGISERPMMESKIPSSIVFMMTFHYYNELHTNKVSTTTFPKSLANWF